MMTETKRVGVVAGVSRSIKAVFWSFFGVRKRRDLERDMVQLHPLHVLLAGLLCAAIFIGALLLVVRTVTHH